MFNVFREFTFQSVDEIYFCQCNQIIYHYAEIGMALS